MVGSEIPLRSYKKKDWKVSPQTFSVARLQQALATSPGQGIYFTVSLSVYLQYVELSDLKLFIKELLVIKNL